MKLFKRAYSAPCQLFWPHWIQARLSLRSCRFVMFFRAWMRWRSRNMEVLSWSFWIKRRTTCAGS